MPFNMGQYLYGPRPRLADTEVLHFKEGTSSNVLVTRESTELSLRVNGKIDASTARADMQTQLALAYFPRIFKPAAKDVLVIGIGSGTTAGATLLFPGTRVTCCELEPAVVDAGRLFSSVNHRPYESPAFSVVLDDARSYLQGTGNLFDVIISEPSNPWMDGVAALYTVEHFRAARRHLNPGGIYVQWVQTYTLDPKDYALIARTVSSAFEHCTIIRVHGGDTLILAAVDRFDPSENLISRVQAEFDALGAVRRDLLKYFQTTDVRSLLLRHVLLEDREIDALAHVGSGVNSDNNMRLAFDGPKRLFRLSDDSATDMLLTHVDAEAVMRRFHQFGCTAEQISVLRELRQVIAAVPNPGPAAKILEFALGLHPNHPGLRADQLLQQTLAAGAVNRSAVAALTTDSPPDANRLGVALWHHRKHRLAAAVFEEIVKVQPRSSTAWENLGANCKADGRFDAAAAAFREACKRDPCKSGNSTGRSGAALIGLQEARVTTTH
jgi:spermidine synthase